MATHFERRRLVLAAANDERRELRRVLDTPFFTNWEVLEAESFERARFILQMDSCDVLVLDASLYRAEDAAGLTWLAVQQRAPVLYLAPAIPESVISALSHGAWQWLPREVGVAHPQVFAATLQQIAQVGELQRRARAAGDALDDCKRQVSRLVALLWDVSPSEGRRPWLPQRQILERLEESVARSNRHGEPFTMALGEVKSSAGTRLDPEDSERLANWTSTQVGQAKRRCDVAGQYGMNGFMWLLPHTTDQHAVLACRRLQSLLEQPQRTGSGILAPVQASFGLVSYSSAVPTAKGLLSRAEERLEWAKSGSGDRVVF
jgi:GGDEF domain-containing protein